MLDTYYLQGIVIDAIGDTKINKTWIPKKLIISRKESIFTKRWSDKGTEVVGNEVELMGAQK